MRAWVDLEGQDVRSIASAMLETSFVTIAVTEEGVQIGLAQTGFFYNIPWDVYDPGGPEEEPPTSFAEFKSKIRRERFGDIPNRDVIEDQMRRSLREAQEEEDDR